MREIVGDCFPVKSGFNNYWMNRQLFVLDDRKVLWKLRKGKDGAQTRLLVIPASLSTKFMLLFPDIPAAGYQENLPHLIETERPLLLVRNDDEDGTVCQLPRYAA
jgi:hypothetical protein